MTHPNKLPEKLPGGFNVCIGELNVVSHHALFCGWHLLVEVFGPGVELHLPIDNLTCQCVKFHCKQINHYFIVNDRYLIYCSGGKMLKMYKLELSLQINKLLFLKQRWKERCLIKSHKTLKGYGTPWVNAVFCRLRHNFCHHAIFSHQRKTVSSLKWTCNTKESEGFDLLPKELWVAFSAVQGHHFHYHKPNCSADFHTCFLAIGTCTVQNVP